MTSAAQTTITSLKSLLLTVHLWLGLASGALFSVVCATGFLIALHPVLEFRLNQERMVLSAPESLSRSRADALVARGLEGFPSPPRSLLIPADPARAWILRGKEQRRYLDPTSGDALGDLPQIWESSYHGLVKLHRWLLLDSKVGRPITGAATLIYLVLLTSGGGLWAMKCYRNFARGLTFRKKVGWKRGVYDAHLVLGIYALLPLLLMASTGLYWSYREPYKAVVYRLLDDAPAPPVAPKKKSASGDEPSKNTALPYQRILDTVNTEYPYPGEVRLLFPHQGDRTLEVEKIRVAGLLQLPTKDVLVLDVASGEVVRRKPFASLSLAEKFLSQVYSLHTGALLGNVSLGLFLLATLVGTSLPISGTLMWWNRQKSLRKSKAILARRSREKLSVPPFTNR